MNTGEVVAGDPSVGQTLVTGDTVNTAARLEQAAQPGEILLGEATYSLVRDAVVAKAEEPIVAKGKSQPVPAYSLVSITPGAAGHARRIDAPMVGRVRELGVLTDAFNRSVISRASQLVTVLGEAGVGKSRLVHEFRQRMEGRAEFLVGRCLSYGEALTYWPLADALRAPAAVDDDDSVESWRRGLMALLDGQPQAQDIVEQVMGLIGVGGAAGSSDAFWAVRRMLESMARRRPLVFVIDDLHWATRTYLDLVEYLAGWTRDAPILLVCLARSELLEARPGWGGGQSSATTVLVEPLDSESTNQLLAHLLGGASLREGISGRIAAAAEGNPLFVEELVAMLAERGELKGDDIDPRLSVRSVELEVPPTIEALIGARLDQLPADELAVLGRGSVIGTQFGAVEVAYLSEEAGLASVRAPLMAMVRRDLLRPDPEAMLPLGADDEAFRFRHQLIRDSAYAGMSKADRARLHERYAGLLEGLPNEKLGPLDEVVGYHLEQAYWLWASLGGEPDVGSRAARHLGAAGLRARERSDWAAAANLLARAAALMPASDPQRIALLPGLGDALVRLGRFDDARLAINEAIEATANGADPAARVFALWVRGHLASLNGATQGEMKPDVEEALAIAQATGDPAQLAYAHGGLAGLALGGGRLADGLHELELALDATQRSGDPNLEALARTSVAEVKSWGPAPAADIDRILADNLAWARDHGRRRMEAHMLRMQALEAARRGQMPEARRLMAKCAAIFEEVGAPLVIAAELAGDRAELEFLAGDHVARERVLRDGYEQLSAMGERGSLSKFAADLADALVDLDRLDEAESMCAVAEAAGAEDDEDTQVGVRLGRGRLAAARGRIDEAVALAAGAVALAHEGEYSDLRERSRLVFAQLLLDAGRTRDARARAQEVLDLVRPRRDIVIANRARDLMKRAATSSRRAT